MKTFRHITCSSVWNSVYSQLSCHISPCLLITTILMTSVSVTGHLTKEPSSVMKALDEQVILKCATNDTLSYIEWTFADPQWTSSKLVSRGHTLKSLAIESNITITNTLGEYSLIISQVRMHHMGIYICQECLTGIRTCRTGATAELIVLEYKPMCNVTVHSPTADEAGQHIIDFWCLFAYSNNVLGKLSVRWTDAREIYVRHKTNRQSRESWIDVESRVR